MVFLCFSCWIQWVIHQYSSIILSFSHDKNPIKPYQTIVNPIKSHQSSTSNLSSTIPPPPHQLYRKSSRLSRPARDTVTRLPGDRRRPRGCRPEPRGLIGTLGKPWGNYGKIGKLQENYGKTMVKSENHGKTIGKLW